MGTSLQEATDGYGFSYDERIECYGLQSKNSSRPLPTSNQPLAPVKINYPATMT